MQQENKVIIKTDEEVAKMRVAGRLAAEVLEMITNYVKPGVSTEYLDKLCYNYIVNEQKAIPACLNYRGFPKSICTSVNHVVCHGIPTEKKVLKKGDIINIDVTVIKDGYHGDTSKMFFVAGKENASIQANRLVNVALECMWLGIKLVKPGCRLGDIGSVIAQHAEKHHFSSVRDFCGHGIGKDFHEYPSVLHYGKANTGLKLQKNMILTIEPMINASKDYRVRVLKDKWTAITKDRSLSAQWEHTILVTDNSYEVLTLRQEEKF